MNKQKKIETLARRDILTYGISYVDLLESKKWEIAERKWTPEIYKSVNPYRIENNPVGEAKNLVIQKSTQCGMTTMAAVRLFHFADFWSIRAMYMLPRQQDYIDFVTTRIDPMISNSDRLRGLLGSPDSTRAKKFGNSFLFFMESTVEPRMMPADVVFIDELDLSDMNNVSTAQNRMDDSDWKLSLMFSTPTLANYGINARYSISDRRQWFVSCPACNHLQVLNWEVNLRIKGPEANPTKVFFGCARCDKPLTLEQIQEGMWVPEYPERSSTMVGYSISQMMTHTAPHLYAVYRDPLTKIREFYRKNLGVPRESGVGSLSRDDILASTLSSEFYVTLEESYDGNSTYYLGADQGNELQVLIAKIPKGESIPRIVHMESIPFEIGFDRLGVLMRLFNVNKAVLDADPNRHSARNLQKDFMGKLLLADYTQSSIEWTLKKEKDGRVNTSVLIGRSEGFDRLMEKIKDGGVLLPGSLSELPQETETIIDHLTAIKRDLREVKKPSGVVEEPVWVELRPSHYAHALLYLMTAVEIARGKDYKIVVVGAGGRVSTLNDPNEIVDEGITRGALSGAVYFLAQVPLDQLKWFIDNKEGTEKTPFPLSVTLVKARAAYPENVVRYAIKYLHADKSLTL
jgi:hypothetical protein